jgi:hypothetical protein
MAQILRPREAFSFTGKTGVPRVLTPNDLVSSDDPDIQGRFEHLLEPVEVSVARTAALETATAAPGETRARRPVKKAAPKPEPKDETKDDE